MSAIRWLVTKDILRFLADRNGAIVTLVMPIALGALIGALMAPRADAGTVELLLADSDGTEESQALIEALQDEPSLDVTVVSEEEARRKLRAGDAAVALILPEGAGAALQPAGMFGGNRPVAPLLYDPSRKMEAEIASGLLTKVVMQVVGSRLSDPQALKSMFEDLRSELEGLPGAEVWVALFNSGIEAAAEQSADMLGDGEAEGAGFRPPLSFEKQEVSAPGSTSGYNSYAHNFAGVLCMFLMFWAAEAAKELIGERHSGVLGRVRMAPVQRWQILFARGVSTVLIALLMTVAVYAVGMLVFGVTIRGSVLGFLAVVFAQAIFVGGFALFMAGVGETERQVANYSTFAILMLSFLGGAMIPTFVMPQWLQTASHVLPTTWATQGLAAMTWRGLELGSALLPTLVLFTYGAVLGLIGIRAHRWD